MIGNTGTLLRFDGASYSTAGNVSLSYCWSVISFGGTTGTMAGCQIGVTFLSRGNTAQITSLTPLYYGASMLTANSGYVVGDFSSILRLSGGIWTPVVRRDFGYYNSVWAENANSVWAVGNLGIDRYNGSTATTVVPTATIGAGKYMNGVFGTSSTNAFAVGDSGTIYRYDGTNWSAMSSGTTARLYSVGGTGSTNMFAVGANGTILRYNGVSWSSMTSPAVGEFLSSVYAVDANNAFASGSNGTIIRFNGTSWSRMTSGTTQYVVAVWGVSATDVYAVGESGMILHYDGTSWTRMTSNTTRFLYGIHGFGSTAVAPGDGSTLDIGSGTTTAAYPIDNALPMRSIPLSKRGANAPAATSAGLPGLRPLGKSQRHR
jgi:hypothetical protein